MEKEKISIITIFLALLTIICTTACSFKGASSGQESKEEESGPFFLLTQKSIDPFTGDMIPSDWPTADEKANWLNIGYFEEAGDFKYRLYDRKIFGDLLCEMYRVYGEGREFDDPINDRPLILYSDVGFVVRLYSEEKEQQIFTFRTEDLRNNIYGFSGEENAGLTVSLGLACFRDDKLYGVLTASFYSDESEETQTVTDRAFLVSCGVKGNLEILTEISPEYIGWDYFFDGDELYSLDYLGTNICRFSDDFTQTQETALESKAQGYFITDDGNAYLYGAKGSELWIKDDFAQDPVYTLGSPYSFDSYTDYAITVDKDGVVIAADRLGAYRLENGEISYCSFMDQDFLLDAYNGIEALRYTVSATGSIQ